MDPCQECKCPVPRSATVCPHCGRPSRYPNVLDASQAEEVDALLQRYTDASTSASALTNFERQELEDQLRRTHVVISRPRGIVEQIATRDNVVYTTFYKLLDSGMQLPQDDEWDRARMAADVLLFCHFHREIRFGALSVDGTGLPNYGEFFLELRDDFIAHRTSVLEENVVTLLDRLDVKPFRKGVQVPPGHRAPWNERHQVGVSKLAGRLRPGMSTADIAQLVIKPGTDSATDEFIEAHVFGSITRRTLAQVTLADNGKREEVELPGKMLYSKECAKASKESV